MARKFVFSKNDDIYKIFQVIDKIPKRYSKVIFDIDKDNDFFSNKWWLKLVLERAKNKGLDIVFVIQTPKQEAFMKSFDANYTWKKIPFYKKIQKNIIDFLELFKVDGGFYKRHYNIIKIFFLIGEFALVIFVVYFIYNLVTPKTTVYIQPAVKIKELIKNIYVYPERESQKYRILGKTHMNYKTDVFSKSYTLKIPVNDISYIQKPSYGFVKFYNTTTEGISLKANTILKTEDGLLFKILNWIYIPPVDANGKPGTVNVKVKALSNDENNDLIGERGNIVKGTKLYIKKMYISYGKKKIYAQAISDFRGGETNANGQVNLQDIEILKKQLYDKLNKSFKKDILKYVKVAGNNKVLLLHKKLYGYNNVKYEIYAKVGDKIPYVKGNISANIYFSYIDKKQLKNIFKKYLEDRLVSENNFLGFDENSIEVLNIENISKNLYLITVSLNALLGYDFDKDYNHIIPKIIEQIRGKTITSAKNIILSYPEIMGVEIKTTNTLNKVSNLKSRIDIKVVK